MFIMAHHNDTPGVAGVSVPLLTRNQIWYQAIILKTNSQKRLVTIGGWKTAVSNHIERILTKYNHPTEAGITASHNDQATGHVGQHIYTCKLPSNPLIFMVFSCIISSAYFENTIACLQ